MTSKVCKSLGVFSFLFNLSRRYGLLPQAGGLGGDGALRQSDAERCSKIKFPWQVERRLPPKIHHPLCTSVFYGSSPKHSLHLVLIHGSWKHRHRSPIRGPCVPAADQRCDWSIYQRDCCLSGYPRRRTLRSRIVLSIGRILIRYIFLH